MTLPYPARSCQHLSQLLPPKCQNCGTNNNFGLCVTCHMTRYLIAHHTFDCQYSISLHLSIHLSIYIFNYVSVYPSISLSIYPFIDPSAMGPLPPPPSSAAGPRPPPPSPRPRRDHGLRHHRLWQDPASATASSSTAGSRPPLFLSMVVHGDLRLHNRDVTQLPRACP